MIVSQHAMWLAPRREAAPLKGATKLLLLGHSCMCPMLSARDENWPRQFLQTHYPRKPELHRAAPHAQEDIMVPKWGSSAHTECTRSGCC